MALKVIQATLQFLIGLLLFQAASRNYSMVSIIDECCRGVKVSGNDSCDFAGFANEFNCLGSVLIGLAAMNLGLHSVDAGVKNKKRAIILETAKWYQDLLRGPSEKVYDCFENCFDCHEGRVSQYFKNLIMELVTFGVLVVHGFVTVYANKRCDHLFKGSRCFGKYFENSDIRFDGTQEYVVGSLFLVLYAVYFVAVVKNITNICRMSSVYRSYKDAFKALVPKPFVLKLNAGRMLYENIFE